MERVLLVAASPFLPWRGAALRARHTAVALAGLGYAVDVVALPGGEPPNVPGVRVLRVPRIPFVRTVRADGISVRGIYSFLLMVRALTLALVNRYRIVHGSDAVWPAVWLAARLCGGGVVYESEGGGRSGGGAWAALRERLALQRADAVVTADPEVVGRMRALRRESRACLIADIPGAWQEVDAARRPEVRARLGAEPETVVLTYVGSFRRFQGVDLLFNALPAVRREAPHVRLVMVGGTPQEIVTARAVLHGAGLENAVVFLGQVPTDELVQVLAASDILIAPRRGGTHAPMKVLDYLRSGTAIVATDCVANRSVLTPACAVLVHPSPEALAGGILTLVRDPARRMALGDQGRERVAREYAFGPFQEGLRRCYEYVCLTRVKKESQ